MDRLDPAKLQFQKLVCGGWTRAASTSSVGSKLDPDDNVMLPFTTTTISCLVLLPELAGTHAAFCLRWDMRVKKCKECRVPRVACLAMLNRTPEV
jgi:hypothetical protein